MTIEQQKATAQSVYEKLKVIDPHCVLAGGAPRDWYFGNRLLLRFYSYNNQCLQESATEGL